MNIELERKAFNDWHFEHWKLNCAYSESIEDAKILYDRVYSHAHAAGERERGFMSWQASANREGYKLVPVEPTYEMWSELPRHLGRYMQMHDRYCPKTLKKYFDRFFGEPPEWLTKEVGNWESDHAFSTADLPVFIYKAMIGACG